MERSEWLKQMRDMTETLYDHISPAYRDRFGNYPNETQLEFIQKFLERVKKGGTVLSAACGAGRYDGILLEAGLRVVGIDQSEGMLALAKERFPQITYQKMGLQEMALDSTFQAAFDGAICVDAMENVCPEDWPRVMQSFQTVLKPGGVLYFTVEVPDSEEELDESYTRAKAMGLPVVRGELADKVKAAYDQVIASGQTFTGEQAGEAVYHYYPSAEQVRAWVEQAGMKVEAEGIGYWYRHFIARKYTP